MTIVIVTPASRELLRNPSKPERITATSTAPHLVPWERAEQRKRKAEYRTDQRAQNAVARDGDRSPHIRLQHDDGADWPPIGFMQTKRLPQPPAQRRRQRRFRCPDEKMLPLPREKPRRRGLMKAQLDGQLLLRPGLVRLQTHG